MTWPIHQKIQRLLKDRKLKKKDLAAHLGIAPQTMTDICKGRSAVTLNHLRGLVSFFCIRADYWIDESREHPGAFDLTSMVSDEDIRSFEDLGVLDAPAWERTLYKVRSFLKRHSGVWEEENGSFTPEEARILEIRETGDIMIPRPEAIPSRSAGKRETEPA
jgi:plasmid maintenance system antidote protein VapI